MPAYIITFEIEDKTRRTAFKQQIRVLYPTFCPITEHAWAIVTEKKAKEIRDALKAFLTASDRLMVIKSGVEAAWYNSYGEDNNAWLKKHL